MDAVARPRTGVQRPGRSELNYQGESILQATPRNAADVHTSRAPTSPGDEHHRAWMRLPSGCRLDLISPDPQAWRDDDLAIRLARTFRWGGESNWSTPLSVAQHSLQVLEIARQSACGNLSPSEQLRELLHDAEEGFLGFDCIAPLKATLGAPFRRVSDGLSAAVWERYELPIWNTGSYGRHKDADEMSAASEAVHTVGWSLHEVRSVLGIEAPILQVDPLSDLFDCEPWKPWAVDVAAERFLSVLRPLLAERTDLQVTRG